MTSLFIGVTTVTIGVISYFTSFIRLPQAQEGQKRGIFLVFLTGITWVAAFAAFAASRQYLNEALLHTSAFLFSAGTLIWFMEWTDLDPRPAPVPVPMDSKCNPFAPPREL